MRYLDRSLVTPSIMPLDVAVSIETFLPLAKAAFPPVIGEQSGIGIVRHTAGNGRDAASGGRQAGLGHTAVNKVAAWMCNVK